MRTAIPSLLVAAALTSAIPLLATPAFADPDALAKVVDGKCVPDQQSSGSPAPCKLVDLKDGYVVLKDLAGASQYLVIATDHVSGIESPTLEQPAAPNYFEAAWEARQDVDASLGRDPSRADIGLAINSVNGRTQNRLHIHVDCMRGDVVAALAAAEPSIGASWALLPALLVGHPYRAMKIEAADLAAVNPFALLASGDPAVAADMGDQTLAVVGATFSDGKPGFYLLTDKVGATVGDLASSEELQDHNCAIAK